MEQETVGTEEQVEEVVGTTEAEVVVDPATETKGQSEEEVVEEETLDPAIYDISDGKKWMEKSKEYEKKYYKKLEDKEVISTQVQKQPETVPFEEMELTPTVTQQFKQEDWAEIVQNYGFEEDTPGTRNAVIQMHNTRASNIALKKDMASWKETNVETNVLAGVDSEIVQDVKNMLNVMNPDKTNPEIYKQAVDIAVMAVNNKKGTDYKTIVSRAKKQVEEDKRIKESQPVVSTATKKNEGSEKLSKSQEAIADRYNMTHKEYYNRLPERSRIG